MSFSTSDIPGPLAIWNSLSQGDCSEYFRIRSSFHQGQKLSSKDRRIITFRRELDTVIRYINRSQDNIEARCIVVGVCFVRGVACINNRQLKVFLNRCKSSINGGFQQLGYVALRTKSKARNCVVTALPSLGHDQNLLRQWTCRVVSDDAPVCFVSCFGNLIFPEITETDLLEEKKQRPAPTPTATFESKRVSFGPKLLEDDLPSLIDFESDSSQSIGSLSVSFSLDFRELENTFGKGDFELEPLDPWKNILSKSKSADFHVTDHWDMFGDEFHM